LAADLLPVYVGVITTTAISIHMGSFGSLPVSPPFCDVTQRRCSICRLAPVDRHQTTFNSY
jgi:hypothetical protein